MLFRKLKTSNIIQSYSLVICLVPRLMRHDYKIDYLNI
jgi:hypothetical protein